jgi:hypothetical protein
MRITQPFVGSGMKTNSLDPPPTISYFEYPAKLYGSATQSLFFFFFRLRHNVNPTMASQLSLYTTWDHQIFFYNGTHHFYFSFLYGGGNKQKIPTAQRWRADTHSMTRSFLFALFSVTIDKGDTKKNAKLETFLFFFFLLFHHSSLVFSHPTHLPDLVCCGPDGLSVA